MILGASSFKGKCGFKMRQMVFMGLVCAITLLVVYRITNYQYQQTEMDKELHRFDTIKESHLGSRNLLDGLPSGIMQARSDLELRPLWSSSSSRSNVRDSDPKVNGFSNHNLLAIPVGIKQKQNVDAIVQKFLLENFSIILFHYDGNMDGWGDLDWSNKAIHIVAQNQTKWWFAKRFLHPDVVSIYDYIFLWDEDLGVKHFNPGRYLDIAKREGLKISQPALDPNSTDIHHRITVRARKKKFHRRVYDRRGSVKCSDSSEGPPCTGFVEGMAPVFSRSAWHCTWHLIQNDLVHGWGMDMKLGYCAQGDRSWNVGVIDSEYIVHKGIQTLGGSRLPTKKRYGASAFDVRTEIRRQSTWELKVFKERWNQAVEEDKNWVDPLERYKIPRKRKWRHSRLNSS
ncbi:hypothetical protein F2P56_008763 [Juglans regia]|uniref:Lysine ketoglutarate reductase trans-splicing-like protein n=2 Tax=Juglans regia TaxID=51240 RepID=A0A833XS61_JUGRE|nr:uncharacterized protein LOC108992602 isoform X1 [Juglans regia]KAF5472013.1 hypothetical protein F2P56_008763 [Juglans regia]